MKKKQNFLIFPSLLLGALLVIANSCSKDDDDDNNNNVTESTFTDPRDGYVYKTIIVGNQEWMAENLRFLPGVNGPGIGSTTTPYYYVYGYNGTVVADAKASSNYATYGVLYNWVAATTACPAGWHLPTDAEWTQLTDYLGGANNAGGKLKEAGTNHWASPNNGANNNSGFTALPGGRLAYGGEFFGIGGSGAWWSATDNSFLALGRSLLSTESYVNSVNEAKELGFSVRCVKD
ncbi:MAG: FISUMP domain-containing protein [Lentimicrobium sp.]